MDEWTRLADLPQDEQNRLRWLIRHAASNGIVAHGVAVKFGKSWYVHRGRLPEFLRERTLAEIAV